MNLECEREDIVIVVTQAKRVNLKLPIVRKYKSNMEIYSQFTLT